MGDVNEMALGYASVVEEICGLNWKNLRQSQLSSVAWAYYYFSVQFRENLQIAYQMYPHDQQLQMLVREECQTDNLSPWPGVALAGETLDHDEFMKRLLTLSPIDLTEKLKIEVAGHLYLSHTRQASDLARAMSIASYECGGLEAVFKAILQAPDWETPLLAAFQHFLVKHIAFDSDPDAGHGALIKHLVPDDRIRSLWLDFRDLLVTAVPDLVI